MTIIDDFNKLDVRVGRITDAEDFPEAKKPSYKLILAKRLESGNRAPNW